MKKLPYNKFMISQGRFRYRYMHKIIILFVVYIIGKGLLNMNSLPKCYSISDLILDNNSITKIEKLDAFPKLTLVGLFSSLCENVSPDEYKKNI